MKVACIFAVVLTACSFTSIDARCQEYLATIPEVYIPGQGDIVVNYDTTSPEQLLNVLIENKGKFVVAPAAPKDWLKEKTVEFLITQIGDQRSCAAIRDPMTNFPNTVCESTVGNIAVMMIKGFATQCFPAPETSMNWSKEEATTWWKVYRKHDGSPKLNNATAFVSTFRQAGCYLIERPDMLESRVDTQLFRDSNSRKQLLNRLSRPEECLVVYILLNELFPNDRLGLIQPGARVMVDGTGTIPIKLMSGDKTKTVTVSLATFGQIVKDYWEPILDNR